MDVSQNLSATRLFLPKAPPPQNVPRLSCACRQKCQRCGYSAQETTDDDSYYSEPFKFYMKHRSSLNAKLKMAAARSASFGFEDEALRSMATSKFGQQTRISWVLLVVLSAILLFHQPKIPLRSSKK